MTVEDARAALLTIGHEEGGVASDALDNFALRGATLSDAAATRFELEAEMAAEVSGDVLKAVEALTRKQFVAYDPSYQTNTSQVLVERLADVPELQRINTVLRVGDVPSDDGGPQLLAMAHAVGSGVSKVVAYRLKGPGIVTRRPRGVPLVPRNGIYRPLEGDLLYYEPRFDAFTVGEFVLFTTATLIQSKLQAEGKARELARATLARVTTNIRIAGFPALERAVMDDPTLRAKMASVARLIESDPDYESNLTTKKLVKFVEDYPEYDISVSRVDGKKALTFDPSPQHRHQIPRLLADDYLHSYLTDRTYEAGSKQRLGS